MGLIRRALLEGWPTANREEPVPLEGTRMDLFNSIIPNWYQENWGTPPFGTPTWPAACGSRAGASI